MFVLTRLAKRVFFQLNSKYKVGSCRSIYCSFAVSVKQNTPILPNTCFASELYSLPMVSLETFQSGWFHECIYAPAETTKLSFNEPRSVPRGSVYALSMFKPMAVPSVSKISFKSTVDLQTKTQRTIDNNKSAFISAILLLAEFHCSRKLISIVSRSRPLPSLTRRLS